MTPQLACYGGINGRQTVPRAGFQAFLCFLQRTAGPATNICDATAVSKGFRRLRAGHDMVSRGNHDIWTAIRAATDQRDIQDEEDTGRSGSHHGLVHREEHLGRRRGRDRCRPLRLPWRSTSWVEGKCWTIRHRAALTILNAIEKDQSPPSLCPRPTIDDFKRNTEHEVSENAISVSCLRCGRRSSRRPAILKRWLQTPCQHGHRITMANGAHRVAPVEGQGRLRHQSTHVSHKDGRHSVGNLYVKRRSRRSASRRRSGRW